MKLRITEFPGGFWVSRVDDELFLLAEDEEDLLATLHKSLSLFMFCSLSMSWNVLSTSDTL